jgi:hypothetical protein
MGQLAAATIEGKTLGAAQAEARRMTDDGYLAWENLSDFDGESRLKMPRGHLEVAGVLQSEVEGTYS